MDEQSHKHVIEDNTDQLYEDEVERVGDDVRQRQEEHLHFSHTAKYFEQEHSCSEKYTSKDAPEGKHEYTPHNILENHLEGGVIRILINIVIYYVANVWTSEFATKHFGTDIVLEFLDVAVLEGGPDCDQYFEGDGQKNRFEEVSGGEN